MQMQFKNFYERDASLRQTENEIPELKKNLFWEYFLTKVPPFEQVFFY